MDLTFTNWPVVDRSIWTVATIGIAYAFGFVLNVLVIRQLNRLAKRTTGGWDDAIARELRKRIPFWSVLIGLRLSIGYWPLEARWIAIAANLIVALAVLSVTLAVAAVAIAFITDAARRAGPTVQVTGLMLNVARMAIVSVGVLVGLRAIGVEITPMLAALGVGGIAVALALQEPLSNLFAGLFITAAGQIRVGHYIRTDTGAEGYVDDLAWNATSIRALAGNIIIVPNAKLAQAIVTNFDLPAPDVNAVVDITLTVGQDLAHIERVVLEAAGAVAREVTGALPNVEPAFRIQMLSDVGVKCTVAVRCRRFEDQFLVRHELFKRLAAAFAAEGIEMATLGKAEGRRQKA